MGNEVDGDIDGLDVEGDLVGELVGLMVSSWGEHARMTRYGNKEFVL